MSQISKYVLLAGSPIATITGDAGGAVGPDAVGDIGLQGTAGANITVTGTPASNLLEIALTGTTQYCLQVGDATGSLDSLAVGATNQVLLGNTGANPSWGTVGNAALTNSSVTLSNGNNITVTGSPLSLGGTASFNLTGTTQHAIQVGDATGSLDSLAIGTAGQVLVSGGAGANPAWTTSTMPTTAAVGDIIYASAINTLTMRPFVNTATRYLKNTGDAATTPEWGQVDLTDGVTGVLPIANGGTGSSTAFDQSNIIYVGKHGNDGNDGLTIEKAKLTFGAAITAAFAIAPASVVCFDEGTYTENLTGQVGVHIFAPNCNLVGAHTIVSGNKWEFGNATVATGTTGFTFNSAGNIAKIIIGRLTSAGTGICAVCIAGDLYLRTYRVNLEAGYLVGTATAGEIFIRADVIHMTGAATVIGVIAGAHIDLLNNHIHDAAGTGTLVYSVAVGASNICITSTSIEIEVLSNISAATVVHLNAGCLTGTLTESGAAKITTGGSTKIENVPIGAITPSTGDFTTITTTAAIGAAYGGTGVASPTIHKLLVSNDAAAFTQLAVGATNEVLLGNNAADPSWGTVGNAALANSSVTLSDGNNITVTGSPLSLGGTASFNLTGCTQYAIQVGDATNSLDSLATGTATQMLQSGGAAANPAWSTATWPATTTQGDVIYSSANNTVAGLAKDANATRYLSNTGASNNPAWAQVELTNGVSGILPVTNGGTGVATFTTAYAVVCAGTTATNPLQPTASAGNAGEVLTSNGNAALPTFQAISGGGIAWSVITANQSIVVDEGYICNKAGVLALALPGTAAVGTVFRVTGINQNLGWSVTQAANQQIHFGNVSTTAGVGGSLASTLIRDSIECVCVVADLEWQVISSIGNVTVV